tara:strand:+ start:1073 stop:1684 length:612 start_codon:yes stop_codon:yes gene_type:complete
VNEFEELEKELRSFRPAKPSQAFEARLETALGESGNLAVRRLPELEDKPISSLPAEKGKIVPFLRVFAFPVSAVAASVALAFYLVYPVFQKKTPPGVLPSIASEDFLPKKEESIGEEDLSPLHGVSSAEFAAMSESGWSDPQVKEILLDVSDEGIIERPGSSPARRYRYRYLDETIWRNPETKTFIRSSVPRQEVVLIGLELY